MSETDVASTEETLFSCKKCRCVLFTSGCLVDEHGSPTNELCNSCCGVGETVGDPVSTLWFIDERNLPDWMEQLVNSSSWIKGKLQCPKCKCRVGSFDYVSGQKCTCGENVLPPVHIVKGKVDLKNPKSTPFIRRPSGTTGNCSAIETDEGFEKHETEASKEHPERPRLPLVTELPSCSNAAQTSTADERGLDTLLVGTSKIKLKKCKISKAKSNEKQDSRMEEEEETSTGNEILLDPSDELVCPVCLDIYMHPFICYPCLHVFCEICLRHLAKNNPQKTLCPLCRQQIGVCLPDHEKSYKIRTLYPNENKTRRKALQNLRNLPLPWQPHYRLRQLSQIGRSFFRNDHNVDENSRGVRETVRTVILLVVLQLIAMFAFLVGFHGGKFAYDVIYCVQSVFEFVLQSILNLEWLTMWEQELYDFK